MKTNSTIAAISTAQGEGGIGVIRVSGDGAIEIADKVFKNINNKKSRLFSERLTAIRARTL